MTLKERLAAERQRWKVLSAYQKFEHAVILVLTALIAVVVVFALWNLVLKVLLSIVSSGFDPTDYEVFQAFFGMIFTVIIALELKRSLLVVADRRHGIIQVRTVLLIALLAVVRKLMIIDLSAAEAQQVFALAAAILAFSVPKCAAFVTIISVNPMTALSGVRSSWLMLERNCDLCWLAISNCRFLS